MLFRKLYQISRNETELVPYGIANQIYIAQNPRGVGTALSYAQPSPRVGTGDSPVRGITPPPLKRRAKLFSLHILRFERICSDFAQRKLTIYPAFHAVRFERIFEKFVQSKPTIRSASYAVRFERIGKSFAQRKPTIWSRHACDLLRVLRGAVREDWVNHSHKGNLRFGHATRAIYSAFHAAGRLYGFAIRGQGQF